VSIDQDKREHTGTRHHLAEKHRRALEEGSAIAADVIAARGYRTVSRSEVPEAFKPYQRRAGLLIPVHSPSGQTGYRLRPDRPRKGKDGKPRKYEQVAGQGNSLDVHPRNFGKLRDPSVPLWITEGEKKGDSLASAGLCAVALFGVWGYAVPGTHGRELLPDFDHIALKGRRVYVVFDEDVMRKSGPQMALERFTEALTARGADVWVIYLPGPEKGVDDFLAADGRIPELQMLARRFEPGDIAGVRLARDEELSCRIGAAWDLWMRKEWGRLLGTGDRPNTTRGYGCRDAAKVAIDEATRSGRVEDDGVLFTLSMRLWALRAGTSRRTMVKNVKHLESEGFLRRVENGRTVDKAASYVLIINPSNLHHEGATVVGWENGSCLSDRDNNPGGEGLRIARMRWTDPGCKAHHRLVPGTRKVYEIPARDGIKRPGKVRGAVIDFLYLAGGSATLQAISGFLGRKRLDNVQRLLAWLVEAGVVTIDGDTVSLACGWTGAVEELREVGREIEAEERDRRRYQEQSLAYRRRDKPSAKSTPSEAGIEAVERGHTRREQERQKATEGLPAPNPEIVEALKAAMRRWPHPPSDTPYWWRETLYVEDDLPYKADLREIQSALAEIRFSKLAA
jgi:hypothetical protein